MKVYDFYGNRITVAEISMAILAVIVGITTFTATIRAEDKRQQHLSECRQSLSEISARITRIETLVSTQPTRR